MRLKLFVLPIAIFISIAAFISYVWPEYEAVQANKVELEKVNEALEAAQDRQQNIQGLTSQLDNNAWSEKAILGYLPTDIEVDSVINSIEQIVNHAEVSLLSIGVIEGLQARASRGEIDPITGAVIEPNELKVGSTGVTLSVTGDYGKLVEFVKKIDAFKRQSKVMDYTIAMQELEDESKILVLTVDAQFGYAPATKLAAQQASDVFDKAQFDLDIIDTYKTQKIKDTVADLNAGQTNGRANPFVY